jgi:phosphoribosylformylglycinamidine synthase
MVGELPDVARAAGLGFAADGDAIALVGSWDPDLAGSELERLRGIELPNGLPGFDLEAVRAAQAAVRTAVRAGTVRSAHDIAEGGLAVALAECCLAGARGATVALGELTGGGSGESGAGVWRALFGEGAGGFVVSGEAEALRALGDRVPVALIGDVGGDALVIEAGGLTVREPLAGLRDAHAALRSLFS